MNWQDVRDWFLVVYKHGKEISALVKLAAETKDNLKKLDERTERMQRDLDYVRGNVDTIVASAVDRAVSEAKLEVQKVASELEYLRGNIDVLIKSAVDKSVSEAKLEAQKVAGEAVRAMYKEFYEAAAARAGWPGNGGSVLSLQPADPPKDPSPPPLLADS